MAADDMDTDAAASLAAKFERSHNNLPVDPQSPASPLHKKQRKTSGASSAASGKSLRQKNLAEAFGAVQAVGGQLAAVGVQSGTLAAAASPPIDIGPLGDSYTEQHVPLYGTREEIKARQEQATAPLAKKSIATGVPCWSDERDSVHAQLDSSQPWGGVPVSPAVREAAEGDPRRPESFNHLVSMLQKKNPDIADEFVRIPLDDYVAKGGVSSTPNWANQTSAFVPELGRPMTFEEFRSASQLPWSSADVGPNELLAREAMCMTRGKLGGGGPFMLHGKEKAAGKHNADSMHMTCPWPVGAVHTKEGWTQFCKHSPDWRKDLTFQIDRKTPVGRLLAVLDRNNLPDFREGFLHVLRSHVSVHPKHGNDRGKQATVGGLVCRLSYRPHVLAHMLGAASRVQPLAKHDDDKSPHPKNSHCCRGAAGANCIASGTFGFSGKLLKPKSWQHPDTPVGPHLSYFPTPAAEVESDTCCGTIAEMALKNGVFVTTMVSYCGLPQHRGFHPTGAIASACGKLTVRCTPHTWDKLRSQAPSDEYRAALDELVGEGPAGGSSSQ